MSRKAFRPCRRCGEVQASAEFVYGGRICATCRADGHPSDKSKWPRYCLRCHVLKAPEEFDWGDGKGARSGTPKYRRRRGICKVCVAQELAQREAKRKSRTVSTWEQRGRMVRRCARCGVIKGLEDGFYVCHRGPNREILGRHYHCKVCTAERVKKRLQARLSNPATRAEELAKRAQRNREWRRRNPEKAREANLKWKRAMYSDPKRHAEHLEVSRIAHRLREERRGRALSQITRQVTVMMPREPKVPRLPAKPLADALDRATKEHQENFEPYMQRLGLEPRSVRAWRNGERKLVQFSVAHIALTRLGLFWWDVWPPEKYPQVARALDVEVAA